MSDVAKQSQTPPQIVEFKAVAQPRTYRDVVACSSRKFPAFAKDHGEEALEAVVIMVLSRITEALAYDIRPVMIIESARAIIQDWPDTKLSALLMFKNEILSGRVGGKLFRWDARVIVECWREYYLNQENEFADFREKQWELQKKKEGEPDPLPGSYPPTLNPEEFKMLPSESQAALLKQFKEAKQNLADLGAKELKAFRDRKARASMSLEQLCNLYEIDFKKVEAAILEDYIEALKKTNVPAENEENFKRFFFKRVHYEAQNDANFLAQYLNR